MKKVLASVLAGSMVLGMASMASAASLQLQYKGNDDYDINLWTVDAKGDVYDDYVNYKISSVAEKQLEEYGEARSTLELIIKEGKESAIEVAAAKVLSTFDRVRTTIANELKAANYTDLASLNTLFKWGKSTSDIASDVESGAVTPGSSNILSVSGSAKFGPAMAIDKIYEANKLLGDLPTVNDIEAKLSVLAGTVVVTKDRYLVSDNTVYELRDTDDNWWNLYNFGEDECKDITIRLYVKKGEELRTDVNSGPVTITHKKSRLNNLYDYYDLKIKANADVRDFETQDFKIEVDCDDANVVFFLKGKVAYSDWQEVGSDERYFATKKSFHVDDHTRGCVFKFNERIDDETRIICNDYVDLLFNGNYGTDFENLRVLTDNIKEVEDFFQDYDIDYYDFIGLPKFAKDITVRVDADSDSFIYEFDKKTGDVVDITDECEYTSDGWTFKRKALKTYIIAEEPYEGANVRADKEPVDDEPTEPDDTDATGSKPNPGTGAMPF